VAAMSSNTTESRCQSLEELRAERRGHFRFTIKARQHAEAGRNRRWPEWLSLFVACRKR
jgi:hypothetical protein